MAGPLENISVAILEHRFTTEFSTLFEKLGATVYACPLLEEKPVENRQELQTFVRRALDGGFDAMIFLTGVGARFLVAEADAIGAKDQFLQALGKLTIIVRGRKPVAALRQLGLRPDIMPDNPTTEGVIEALRSQDLRGKNVGVQLYGTPNPQLVAALEEKGAVVTAVQVYAYGAAADSTAVNKFISRIVNGQVQVIVFTSGPQVRMLFDFAAQSRMLEALATALRTRLTVASIGEVTSRALHENGITPQIVPAQSKMGALAQAVGDHFARLI